MIMETEIKIYITLFIFAIIFSIWFFARLYQFGIFADIKQLFRCIFYQYFIQKLAKILLSISTYLDTKYRSYEWTESVLDKIRRMEVK